MIKLRNSQFVYGVIFKFIVLTASVLRVTSAQTNDPVLYFSDITSGPKTGNSDASSGRVAGQDGAIVTIWGVNLGTTKGNSIVVCNGTDAASYYAWGNATQSADLYAYHKMQMISFQVSHLAQDDTGEIIVTVNGRNSNALSFTVRAGNIYFVKTTGDDNSGNGSWSQPWNTIQKAVSSLANGDIVYVLDGVNANTEGENSACVSLDSDGTASQPKALIVYPGATASVGTDSIQRAFWNYDGNNDRITNYWIISKFSIHASEVGIYTHDGFRVIGNRLTAPNGDGMDGVINIEGNNVFVLGNELVDCGSATCNKLYHTIYGKGMRKDDPPRAYTESMRDIGWNYIHDNKSNRAINIYSEQANSAYIEGHRVHDNVIVNQRGDGIMLGYYVTGDNWIYNNLIIKAGLGPEWADPSYHVGIRINTGHENVNKTDVYCYNNTLYGCGFSGAAFPEETGHILISPEALTLSSNIRLSNNIIYSTGEPYLAGESTSLASGNHKNCWFGNGAAPGWDTGALNSDPLFVNASGNIFELNQNSPCINTGLDVSPVLTQDLLGVPREKTATDLGVFEFIMITSVELLTFSAAHDSGVVHLRWTTTSETNCAGFAVQRSSLLVGWQSAGFIKGHGTTTIQNYYHHDDPLQNLPMFGVIYYRLKIIDTDGSYKYSPVVEIKTDEQVLTPTLYEMYPNPLSSSGQEGTITFTLPSQDQVRLFVVDNLGINVAVLVDEIKEPGKYQIQFNPSSLPNGTYYYVLQSSSSSKVKKVIVVR